jgi:hypothetical protein
MPGHCLVEKLNECFARLAGRAASNDLAAVHLQSGKQRDRSLSHIFDRVPFHLPGVEVARWAGYGSSA